MTGQKGKTAELQKAQDLETRTELEKRLHTIVHRNVGLCGYDTKRCTPHIEWYAQLLINCKVRTDFSGTEEKIYHGFSAAGASSKEEERKRIREGLEDLEEIGLIDGSKYEIVRRTKLEVSKILDARDGRKVITTREMTHPCDVYRSYVITPEGQELLESDRQSKQKNL